MANGFNFQPGAYQTMQASQPGANADGGGGTRPPGPGTCPPGTTFDPATGKCKVGPPSTGCRSNADCEKCQECRSDGRCITNRTLPDCDNAGSNCPPGTHPSAGCTRPGGEQPCVCVSRGGTVVNTPTVRGPETNLNFRGFTPGVMEGFRGFQPWQPMGTNNAFYGQGAAQNLQQLMAPQSGLQPTSIYDVYQSAIPVMEQARDRQINQSLAQAGFGGTRYGTAAMREAGRIGQETALQQNQLLSNLLYGQGQSDADRALQATQMSMGLGQQLDQGMMDRIRMLQGAGAMEQQRGDQLAQIPFQEFMQSRQGWIPQLLGAAPGGLSPNPGESIVEQSVGGPGAFDYLTAIGIPILTAMISDKKLKKNIHKVADLPGGIALKSWQWKKGGAPSMGVIAQEVEKKIPGAVTTAKVVDYAKVLGHVMKHANGGCTTCEAA